MDLLPGDRRQIICKLVEPDRLTHVRELSGRGDQQPAQVWLPDFAILEDIKNPWVTKPITDLHRALDRMSEMDYTDDRAVGRKLRKRAQVLDARAEAVAELDQFLANFEGELISILRTAAKNALGAASDLVASISARDERSATEATASFNAVMSDVEADRVILRGLPLATAEDLDLQTYDTWHDVASRLLQVELDPEVSWRENVQRIRERRISLYDVGGAQLGYLNPRPRQRPGFDENYVRLALKLGDSRFPLLAHRAAFLTTKLVAGAVRVDRRAAHDLVASFFRDESGWITASGTPYEEALAAFIDEDDRMAILEAYRIVGESVLRPYGSLLVALAAMAERRPMPEPKIAATLGELLQRLAPTDARPLRLLESFIRPSLRNAEAHRRVAVDSSGDLIARNDDGSTTILVPNHVYGLTTGLRSALDGVDVAVNVIYARDLVDVVDPDHYWPSFVSEEMLRHFAVLAAEEHTRGWVTAVESKDRVAIITFEGQGNDQEFEPMLSHLFQALRGSVDEVILVAQDGSFLGRFGPVSQG